MPGDDNDESKEICRPPKLHVGEAGRCDDVPVTQELEVPAQSGDDRASVPTGRPAKLQVGEVACEVLSSRSYPSASIGALSGAIGTDVLSGLTALAAKLQSLSSVGASAESRFDGGSSACNDRSSSECQ